MLSDEDSELDAYHCLEIVGHQNSTPGLLPPPDERESRTDSVPSIAADDALPNLLPQFQILI